MARRQLAGAARLHRRRQQAVAIAAIRRAATPAAPSTSKRYDLSLINMLYEYMSSCYILMFIILPYISSMFDLYVVVLFYVMFNILKLIMEIVANYPTSFDQTPASTFCCYT